MAVCPLILILCCIQEVDFQCIQAFFLIVKVGVMTSKLFICQSWKPKSKNVLDSPKKCSCNKNKNKKAFIWPEKGLKFRRHISGNNLNCASKRTKKGRFYKGKTKRSHSHLGPSCNWGVFSVWIGIGKANGGCWSSKWVGSLQGETADFLVIKMRRK